VALTPSGQLGSNLCQRDTFFAHGTSCARDRVRPAEGSSRTLTAKTQEAERAAKEIERAAKDAERAARQQAEARVAELEAALEALEKKRGPAR
jgi:ABC-type transporter Mla subunit MlaD